MHDPISIVRMAVDVAYGTKEWRETTSDGDKIAYRTLKISRRVCRAVAEFSFMQAERTGARVFGGPKFTVSPVYEGCSRRSWMRQRDAIPTSRMSRS